MDRVAFFMAALAGMQLPSWMLQYQQRLGGQLDEASLHLGRYQDIANTHTDGDLMVLVNQFRVSADSATRETGHVIWQLHDRVEELSQHSLQLASSNLARQLLHLSQNLHTDLARATLENFQPAIVLNFEAISMALVAGILVSSLIHLLRTVPLWLKERLSYRRMPKLSSRG